MDDLEESPVAIDAKQTDEKPTLYTIETRSIPKITVPLSKPKTPAQVTHTAIHSPLSLQYPGADKGSSTVKSKRRAQQSVRISSSFDITNLRPSQRPPSVSDRPGFKRKAVTTPWRGPLPAPKRPCAHSGRSTSSSSSLIGHDVVTALSDFGISTQEVNSFFADDDEIYSGSPPIAV
jgi:hypothetical protein